MRQILSLRIERFAMGGSGLGFHEGKAIFVAYTAPGDVVDVAITHERKDHAFGKVQRFIGHAEGYQEPGCEAFGGERPCGGCDWLMLPNEQQVKYKEELVKGLFAPLLGTDVIHPTLPSPKPNHYRNKVFMPVGVDARTGMLQYGIYARWSHEIVPHTACLNHPPVFDAMAKRIVELCQKAGVQAYDETKQRGSLRHLGFRSSADGSEVLVALVTHSAKLLFSGLLVKQLTAEFPMIKGIVQNINRQAGNVILGAESKLLWGRDHIFDRLEGIQFRISYRSFWQVNSGTMELVLDSIRSRIKPDATVLDAFCGIGAIGLCLAAECKQLILLEELPEAIADAKENAALNGIGNVSYITGRFEIALPMILAKQTPEILIIDPPRSGIDKASLELIAGSGISRIIYLSCSPVTLARDLKRLMADGNYKCLSLQSFDMFPNTWHIECLVVLERKQ